MFLTQNEENKQERAKEFYDVISKFEVMLATLHYQMLEQIDIN